MSTGKPYVVAVFGVPDFEQQILQRIFSISASRTHQYRLVPGDSVDCADIVMVDGQNRGALIGAQVFLANNKNVPQVTITNGTNGETPYPVRRPFTATRMLRLLDQVVAEKIVGSGAAELETTPAESEAAGAPAESAHAPKSEYRALVVDDSLPVRRQVGNALKKNGIVADFAENGESALELIRNNAYDIVFLDVIMPGVDGYEVCKAIKRDRERKFTPVIMLTGKSSPFDRVKGKLSGCDTYLTKPVSLDEFNRTLNKCLNHSIAFKPASE